MEYQSLGSISSWNLGDVEKEANISLFTSSKAVAMLDCKHASSVVEIKCTKK